MGHIQKIFSLEEGSHKGYDCFGGMYGDIHTYLRQYESVALHHMVL